MEVVGRCWASRPDYSRRWEIAEERLNEALNEIAVRAHQRSLERLTDRLETVKGSLCQARSEGKNLGGNELAEQHRLEVQYASLLQEPMLPYETANTFENREFSPCYLGNVYLASCSDVRAMNMLREPDELVLIVTVGNGAQDFEPSAGKTYGIFVLQALFDEERDDQVPMERDGLRDAQRRSFQSFVVQRSPGCHPFLLR